MILWPGMMTAYVGLLQPGSIIMGLLLVLVPMFNRGNFVFEFIKIILICLTSLLFFPSVIKLFVNVIDKIFHFIA